ncbi:MULTISPECIES: ketopantoate reductase family protein [Subtercola]|uniref:2-dehydropantoate 2-reductase n=1 Tax=Subtercola vilae TaxID=2056433 RepID=A0A4V4RGZ7_9MICO|nr:MULTISPECIES: 2-dehydropantoate 2-reductase [Subtercola]MEA9984141.1 2-dehydropantoate 2-reductase [Subtercola sp. RTI3]TIH38644.1 2-dehydropantoate 2-reductase [Subtercola vilae]
MTGPRVAVLGAGANGAAIGADLTRAGVDVTLIEQWPAHVEAMRANGVEVRTPTGTTITPVTVLHLCEVAELRRPFDIVFVVVKAYDTRWVCELVKPLLTPTSLVVGLQNGMSLDDMADVVGHERTLGAVIEVAANMFEPGIVNQQAPAWFAIGSFHPSTEGRENEVAAVLRHAGAVEISPDIRSSKWMKLVVNAAELVPSAILDLPLADAEKVPGMRDFMVETGKEAVRTAVALGSRTISIFGMEDADESDPDRFAEALLEVVLDRYTLPDTMTTVLQDWRKGRRCEVDELNGLVADEQRQLGGSAPNNELVASLARRIELGELSASPANIRLLVPTIAEV